MTTLSLDELEAYRQQNQERIQRANNTVHTPSELGEILKVIAANPNFKDKRWMTEKLDQLEAHETKIALLRALEADPDLFYKILMVGGAGATILALIVPDFTTNVQMPGLAIADYALIPAGLTASAFAGVMLAWPRVFGPDGIKFEGEATVLGLAGGTIKIG